MSFLLKRTGISLLVVWLAYTLSFFLIHVLPGDAVVARLGGEVDIQQIPKEQIAELRDRLGLTGSPITQYFQHLAELLQGNLGLSLYNDQPVSSLLSQAVTPTLQLAGMALAISIVVGVGIAIASNLTRMRWLQTLLLSLPAIGMGLPTFWVGILLISLLSFRLQWLPASGNVGFSSLVLPAITLAIVPSAMIAQVLGASIHWTRQQPFAATTAPAKGASPTRVVLAHTLRNASLPALTVGGLVVGQLIAGSVIIETVFSRPGIGQVMINAVQTSDLTVVQGVVLLSAVVFVSINLIVDMLYPVLDPRLRGAQYTFHLGGQQ